LSALPSGILQVLTHVSDYAEYRMSSYHLAGKKFDFRFITDLFFEANTS